MKGNRPMRWVPLALAASLLLGSCGTESKSDGGPASLPSPGEPVAGLQPGVWTWVDFPDSACDDGSPTGIGVNLGSGPDLVVFLNGGGACWSYFTCFVLNSASHGPFGKAQFTQLGSGQLQGSVLDRALSDNPYQDASLVFVPYCTGDVHGGDNVLAYDDGLGHQRTYHHVGHANLVAFLRRIAATWPSPRKLVVSGSSAGGFGSLINYDTFRHYWPGGAACLVDDSGPPLERGAISQTLLLDPWFASWRLDRLLDPLCGQACHSDLSAGLAAVAKKYPNDRLALLSSLRDQTISGYFSLSGAEFEQDLLKMSADVMAPTPNARWFFVPGSSHTMLGNPAAFAQGVHLLTWLAQQLNDDPGWASRPP
jgi:hypothetical protein